MYVDTMCWQIHATTAFHAVLGMCTHTGSPPPVHRETESPGVPASPQLRTLVTIRRQLTSKHSALPETKFIPRRLGTVLTSALEFTRYACALVHSTVIEHE